MLHIGKELDELLTCKEQELKELQAHQIHFQKTTLQETQKQLQELQKKFNKLKEDFTYNLRVLEERDKELEYYEILLTQLKMVENSKQAEVSELRIQVEKLEKGLAQEARKREALQYQYQQKLKENQLELKHLHSSKDTDIHHYCEKYENIKKQLERKLQEVEGELALQKQELMAEFDVEMKKREHEFQQKANEMSNVVLSHELKVKLLTKELETLRKTEIKMAESIKMAETTNSRLEKEIKCKDWEIKDLEAVKGVRIRDLERKLESVHLNWKKEKEILETKHAAIDYYAREKDAALVSVKEAHTEETHQLESQLQQLQMNNETLEIELCQAERRHADHLKEKEIIIKKYEQELKGMKTNWDSQVAQLSREIVSKDIQIQAVQEEEIKLKLQVTSLLRDVDRYKQQLTLAAEREEILERAKVQTELDWQRRCENAERNQYQKSEALIQTLSTARDQVTAELQKKEQRIQELETLISAVTQERDHAVQELQKHGHESTRKKQDVVGDTEQALPSADLERLQEQNNTLRAVIAAMRREMETLTGNYQATSTDHSKMKTQDAASTDLPTASLTPGNKTNWENIQSLEEVRQLKNKCWAAEKSHEIPPGLPGKIFLSSLNSSICDKSTQTYYEDCMGRENNGTVHTEKVAPESGIPRADSIGGQKIQSNHVTKKIQDDSVHQRQQLFGVGAGDAPPKRSGNYAQIMRSRLKEAARKIYSLSKEKQQLLELVNRLRAEFGTVTKEGFQCSKRSKESHVLISSGVLSPKEYLREPRQGLLTLEHLHSRLPTQVQADSLVRNQTADSPKHEAFGPHASEQPPEEPKQFHPGLLSSSGTHSSLEEIWQILEMGSSPSILSLRSNTDQENSHMIYEPEKHNYSGENGQEVCKQSVSVPPLTIRGNTFVVHSMLRPKKLSCNQPRKLQTSQQKSKIRNYNVKN